MSRPSPIRLSLMRATSGEPLVSSQERGWVILISGILVTLTLVPYALAYWVTEGTQWQFMGILTNTLDGASYLAKIGQGYRGDWLFHIPFTPEQHNGAAAFLFYLALGHLARLTGLSPVLMFHLARMVFSFFMLLSIYQLGATVWSKTRPRRLFFGLCALGSGLGWLVMLFGVRNPLPPDLNVPEAFPLYSAYINPHFPFAIGLLALMMSVLIRVFRPGFDQQPDWFNGGFALLLMTVALTIVLPQAVVVPVVTLAAYLVARAIKTRRFPFHELRWSLLVWIGVVPFASYYLALIRYNWAFAIWNEQNVTLSPPVWHWLIGYGLLLVTAIPGIHRAVTMFEQDGDQLMLTWLIVGALMLYAPFNMQRRLSVGLILVIVYFAVRALEDFWFERLKGMRRKAALLALYVLILPSNVIALALPAGMVLGEPERAVDAHQLLSRDYWNAILWLHDRVPPDALVLASPDVAIFIPAWSGQRVVYAHPFETLNAVDRCGEVIRWYRGEECDELLADYDVDYVIFGPQEAAILDGRNPCVSLYGGGDAELPPVSGDESCAWRAGLAQVAEFGSVAIYEVEPR